MLTKTHLYGLTQKKNRKNGMVEITVRHPLSSIIKIATKSSCPEMLSFTHGDKLPTVTRDNKEQDLVSNGSISSVSKDMVTNEYTIKGKDWFFIPDYAGEAASAVKLQILQIIDLV